MISHSFLCDGVSRIYRRRQGSLRETRLRMYGRGCLGSMDSYATQGQGQHGGEDATPKSGTQPSGGLAKARAGFWLSHDRQPLRYGAPPALVAPVSLPPTLQQSPAARNPSTTIPFQRERTQKRRRLGAAARRVYHSSGRRMVRTREVRSGSAGSDEPWRSSVS